MSYTWFRGDTLTVQSDNVTASAWLDRKVVNTMATGCDGTETGVVLRTQKDGSRLEVSCPRSCVEYNKYMGGVDRGDQLRGYYQYHLKNRKFYKYIANFFFHVAITKSFILYSIKHPSTISLKTFHEKVALQLIGNYCSRQRVGRGGDLHLPQLPIQHFPRKKPTTGNGTKCGHCSMC